MGKKFLFIDPNIIKILEGSDFSGGGGASIQAWSWLKGLLLNKQRVGILNLRQDITSYDINIDLIPYFDTKYGIPILNWIYYRYPQLKKSIKLYNPDYIYQAGAGFITWIIARMSKKGNSIFIHRIANDIDTDHRINKKLSLITRLFYNRGLKNADLILCQNNYQFDKLRNKFPQKKIKIFHNPFYIELRNKKQARFKERKYVAWLGLFQAQKNMQALLTIAQEIKHVNFFIAGKPSKQIDRNTENVILELEKLKNVSFVGFLDRYQVFDFLKYAYLLLNTSHYEGFSNTFLESFSVGTPVITNRNVDPDEIIFKNNLGKSCTAIDEQIEGIIDFSSNENVFEQISKRCIGYVNENHNAVLKAKELILFLENEL